MRGSRSAFPARCSVSRPKSRGRNYRAARGVVIESLLRVLYWGSWPATLWEAPSGRA